MKKKLLFVLVLILLGTYNAEVKATNERDFVIESSSLGEMVPPSFDDPTPRDITARVGEKVSMKIKVKGEPLPSIEVFKNYEKITPSDKIWYTINLDVVTITIKSVKSEDAGRYSIDLANVAGTASCNWKLIVTN